MSKGRVFTVYESGGWQTGEGDRIVALVRTIKGDYELWGWHGEDEDRNLDLPSEGPEKRKAVDQGVAAGWLNELRGISISLSDRNCADVIPCQDGGHYALAVGDEEGGLSCRWGESPALVLQPVARFAQRVWSEWDDEETDEEERDSSEERIPSRAGEVIGTVGPLHWEGYAIKDFLDHDYLGKMSCSALACQEISTKMFGPSDMELAWLYFYLQRVDRMAMGMQRLVFDIDDSRESAGDKPSWYHLLFWETAELSFPACFNGTGSCWPHDEFEAFKKTDEFAAILDFAARALSGMAKKGGWKTRVPSSDELSQALRLTSLHESEWIGTYRRGPAQTLAYSFKPVGCLKALEEHHKVEDGKAFLSEMLSAKAFAARLRGERPLVPKDPWEARLMLFGLCRWMEYSLERRQKDPFEFDDTVLTRLFALLYLRFYRKGLDPSHLTRSQFRSDWDSIPFVEKEMFAAKCRRLLLRTRNDMWLSA